MERNRIVNKSTRILATVLFVDDVHLE